MARHAPYELQSWQCQHTAQHHWHVQAKQAPRKRHCRSHVVVARAERVEPANKPLVVVGSLNVDTVLSVQRIPKGGETLIADDLAIYPGGKACFPGYHSTAYCLRAFP